MFSKIKNIAGNHDFRVFLQRVEALPVVLTLLISCMFSSRAGARSLGGIGGSYSIYSQQGISSPAIERIIQTGYSGSMGTSVFSRISGASVVRTDTSRGDVFSPGESEIFNIINNNRTALLQNPGGNHDDLIEVIPDLLENMASAEEAYSDVLEARFMELISCVFYYDVSIDNDTAEGLIEYCIPRFISGYGSTEMRTWAGTALYKAVGNGSQETPELTNEILSACEEVFNNNEELSELRYIALETICLADKKGLEGAEETISSVLPECSQSFFNQNNSRELRESSVNTVVYAYVERIQGYKDSMAKIAESFWNTEGGGENISIVRDMVLLRSRDDNPGRDKYMNFYVLLLHRDDAPEGLAREETRKLKEIIFDPEGYCGEIGCISGMAPLKRRFATDLYLKLLQRREPEEVREGLLELITTAGNTEAESAARKISIDVLAQASQESVLEQNTGIDLESALTGIYEQLLAEEGVYISEDTEIPFIMYPQMAGDLSGFKEILKNRVCLSDTGDDRPVALIVMSEYDHNRSQLDMLGTSFPSLLESGFQVFYYEVNNEEELYSVFPDVCERSGRQVSFLQMNIHGGKGYMALSKTGGEREKIKLSREDAEEIENLNQYMAEDSEVLLCACYSGAEEKKGDNETFSLVGMFYDNLSNSGKFYAFEKTGKLELLNFSQYKISEISAGTPVVVLSRAE